MARRPLLSGDMLPLLLRLWRDWLRPHAGTLAVVLVLIAVIGVATGFYPTLIKAAFDAFDAKDAGALAYGPVLVIAVTAVRGFALLGQTVLTNRVVTRDRGRHAGGALRPHDRAGPGQLGRESPRA